MQKMHTECARQIIDKLRHASKAVSTLPEAWQRAAARQAYGVALRNTFIFGLSVALVIFVVAVFVRRVLRISRAMIVADCICSPILQLPDERLRDHKSPQEPVAESEE